MPSDKKFFKSFMNILTDSGRETRSIPLGSASNPIPVTEPMAEEESSGMEDHTNNSESEGIEITSDTERDDHSDSPSSEPLPSIGTNDGTDGTIDTLDGTDKDVDTLPSKDAYAADIVNDSDADTNADGNEYKDATEIRNDDTINPSDKKNYGDVAAHPSEHKHSIDGADEIVSNTFLIVGNGDANEPLLSPCSTNSITDIAVESVRSEDSSMQDDFDTDAIVNDMPTQDLRDFTKHILRLAIEINDTMILSEVKSFVNQHSFDTNSIINDMAIQDLQDFAKEILRTAKEINDTMILSEVKAWVNGQPLQRQNKITKVPDFVDSMVPVENSRTQDDFDTDAIVNDMKIHDLQDLTKRILRIAKEINDTMILSEVHDISTETDDKEIQALDVVQDVPTGNSADREDGATSENLEQIAEHSGSVGAKKSNLLSTGSDQSHPDYSYPLPPLVRNSRSYETDRADAAKPISPRKGTQIDTSMVMSPTVRTSNRLNISEKGAEETIIPSKEDNPSKTETSESAAPRGGSIGEPSIPALRHKASPMATSKLPPQPTQASQSKLPPRSRSKSPDNLDNTDSSRGSGGSFSLQMSNGSEISNKTDESYSHLDGMNQPKSSFGEMSLGSDFRMIFDDFASDQVPGPVNAAEKADDSQERGGTGHATIPAITEEEDDDEESSATPVPPALATIPTIAEEEKDNEESQQEDLQTSTSMTVLPSGAIVKRETVMLKPRRPTVEPPGEVASTNSSRYLNHARSSLRSPPSSPQKLPSNHVESKPKKIMNPYYALSYYSGGKGEDNAQASESTEVAVDPPGEDAETIHLSTHERKDPPENDTESTQKSSHKRDSVSKRESLSWEQKFEGVGACYLVFHRNDDELNIHYSESPMENAVGVWTSPDIANFKESQGLSDCELIGICAAHVMQDAKNFCHGWCQFIKAAKIMDGTVTALEGLGLPVDFYLYDKGRTIQVSRSNGEAVFDTQVVDAVACVPKGRDFPATGIVGKKWGKVAKKLGAVALFKSLSTKTSKVIDEESPVSGNTNNPNMIREVSVPLPVSDPRDKSLCTLNTHDIVTPLPVTQKSVSEILDMEKIPSISELETEKNPPTSEPPMISDEIVSASTEPPLKDDEACYLVYEPDSSGQLVEHYSKTLVDFAIGRWIPGSGKKIAGFKFKRNYGRNVLIRNCSGGVQGRKNFYSGWCQFVRSARNMKGYVTLWDTVDGQKGLKVDVFLYTDDNRPTHQTIRMEEGIPYSAENIIAVACLPKGTPFFDNMTADLLMWLAEGSKQGYSSKM